MYLNQGTPVVFVRAHVHAHRSLELGTAAGWLGHAPRPHLGLALATESTSHEQRGSPIESDKPGLSSHLSCHHQLLPLPGGRGEGGRTTDVYVDLPT